ncbi:MAG: peroxide stress protein YaaA, partial [Oscillospiraceae bacterium]|nr:peroxide stress protein YaaA [Oscillospiraceae bacterium]
YLTCTFGQWRDGRVVEKGTACKMARGQMVRWLAENRVDRPEDIRAFSALGYRFDPELSGENRLVFLLGGR